MSLVWLVVAQRLITAWGGRPVLAAALAESLPLGDGSVSGVVSLDVIEHVGDPGSYLSEINRTIEPGGCFALCTPNRYSLAAEPHVSLWGVGWLPSSWQEGYVKWRSGKSYTSTKLLSTRGAAKLLRRHTSLQFEILVPPVSEVEIARFPRYRAILARLYNRLVDLAWSRWLFLRIGPFFRIVGSRV